MAGTSRRIVSHDPALTADLDKQREELRRCAEVRKANLDKLKGLAQEALSITQTVAPDVVEKALAAARTHLNGSVSHGNDAMSSSGETLRRKVSEAGEVRKNVFTRLTNSVQRVVSDSKQHVRPIFDPAT